MSNEIQMTFQQSLANGNLKDRIDSVTVQIDQTIVGMAAGTQTIGLTEENLDIGDIATVGVLFMRNLDASNYVDWGLDDSGTMRAIGRLKPGEIASFRMKPGVNLRLLADTAPVKIHFKLYED